MKHFKLSAAFAAVVMVTVTLGGAIRAFADDTGGSSTVIVSPMTQRLILAPGESKEASIKVSNPNDASRNLDYSISVGAFSQHGTDGSVDDYEEVDTETVTTYNQIMDWIRLDKDSGSVAPNETDIINFTIDVPKDAPAGGQYATILVQDDTRYADGNSGNIAIQSVTQVGSIIYAEVTGETREVGDITENNIPSFLMASPLEATSMVKNDGNIHADASYTLQVWPLFSNEEICTNEENPDTSFIMPGTEKYHAQTCDLPSVGIFNAKQTVSIFGETSVVEKVMIICPIWLLFLIFFIIAAIIIWIVVRVRSRSKATKRQTSKEAE